MNNKKTIVWLHLSDLHYCEAKTGWDAHRVLDPLLADLKKMEKDHGLLPQLIFFTGDLAFGNYGSGPGSTLAEQYQGAEAYLTSVRQAFSSEVPKANLFLVPGNHDVDRSEVTDALTEWIEKQTSQEAITKQIKSDNKQWQHFMDRLKPYRDFLRVNAYSHLLNDPKRLVYAEVREINGVKLGIGGFNSAWNCGRDKEKGKLWLAGDWQNGTIVRQLKAKHADLRLALIHHPPGWFVEYEDLKIGSQMERDFNFFLHGHEHQGWVNPLADCHVRIAAAASYEKADHVNGYNFVRLNLESGDVEIWLRKYDDDGGGWIPRVIGNNKTNNDGLWLIRNCDRYALLKKKTAPSKNGTSNTNSPDDTKDPTFFTVSVEVRNEVRSKIKELIQHFAVQEIVKALLENQDKNNKVLKPEEILVPLDIEPFPIISTLDVWYNAVELGLKRLADEQSPQLEKAGQISKEIMEWLLRLAVPDAWVLAVPDETNGSQFKAEKHIPEQYPIWAELGKGRLTGVRPSLNLALNNFTVSTTKQLSHDELESGLFDDDSITKILQIIWIKVELCDPPVDQDWRKQLPIILQKRKQRDERYHITIPFDHFEKVASNSVWNELESILESFNIFVCGTGAGDPVLIVPEDNLMVEIREFLRLLKKYS